MRVMELIYTSSYHVPVFFTARDRGKNTDRESLTQAKKILVVDDDPDILEALELMLRSVDYEVITDIGDHIEEKILEYQPNLILLDVLLNGLDGREICQDLRHQKSTKDSPVVLISAHADVKSSATRCGANDFLAKPFEMDDLLAVVEKYTS